MHNIQSRPSEKLPMIDQFYLKPSGSSTMKLKNSIHNKLKKNTGSFQSSFKESLSELPIADIAPSEINSELPPWWTSMNLGNLEASIEEFNNKASISAKQLVSLSSNKKRNLFRQKVPPQAGLVYTSIQTEKKDPISSLLSFYPKEHPLGSISKDLEKAKIQECLRRIVLNRRKRV